MKIIKKIKKGFTLVELVVVIAVIAILSGVSVVTYIGVTNNAKKSEDQLTIAQVNKCLTLNQTLNNGNTPKYMHQAIEILNDELGTSDAQSFLTPATSGYRFAWDYSYNRFVILENNNIVYTDPNYPKDRSFLENECDFWIMTSSLENNVSYSQYVTGTNFTGSEFEVIAGVDVGYNTGAFNIKHYCNDTKNIIFRTLAGDMKVNAPNETIYHYGESGNLELENVGTHSWHEYGKIHGTLKVTSGSVYLEQNSRINELVGEGTSGVNIIYNGGVVEKDLQIITFSQINYAVNEFLHDEDYEFTEDMYTQNYDDPQGYEWDNYNSNGREIVIIDCETNEIVKSTTEHTIYNLIPNKVYKCELQDESGSVIETRYIKPTGNLRMIYQKVIANVRDLGGWNADGGTIKYNKLIRGGELSTIDSTGYHVSRRQGFTEADTFDDFDILKNELGVDLQLDLRMEKYFHKINNEYVSDIEGVSIAPISITEGGYLPAVKEEYYNADQILRDGKIGYGKTVEALRAVINNIIDDGTTYFHCQAGADRTGTIAFLLEGILGVSKEDMLTDYSLTSFSSKEGYSNRNKTNADYSALVQYIESLPGDSLQDKFLDWYLTAGFTIDEINAIRGKLIEGNPKTLEIPTEFKSVNFDEYIIRITDLDAKPQLNTRIFSEDKVNSISYKSDNSCIEISSAGVISVKGNGRAKVSVTVNYVGGESRKAFCYVEVSDYSVRNISLDIHSKDMYVGDEYDLTASIYPSDATNQNIIWTSSDTDVAEVNAGHVIAKAAGTVTITAKSEENQQLQDTCVIDITVPHYAVTSVSLNQSSGGIKVGEALTLEATVKPDNASNPSITWESSDTSVATVNNGVVTAIKEGSATITAKSVDVPTIFAECDITVQKEDVKVTSISLDKTAHTLMAGETFTLTATTAPKDATDQSVTWKSSDTGVATVDNKGVVTAQNGGSATITVTANDGSGKEATCVVTVNEDVTKSLSITNKIQYLDCMDKYTMTVSVDPTSEASSVKWSSDNEDIATVSSSGVVTAKGVEGTVIITASSKYGKVTDTCEITIRRNYLKDESGNYNYFNAHLSSGGGTSGSSSNYTTEYIPFNGGDKIVISGFIIDPTSVNTTTTNMNAVIYTNNKDKLCGGQFKAIFYNTQPGNINLKNLNNVSPETGPISLIQMNNYYDGSLKTFDKDTLYYLRVETNVAPSNNCAIYVIHNG